MAGQSSDMAAPAAHALNFPSPNDIRAQLKRIVESPEFKASRRAQDFLRYVVEEALAGRGSRIKGYTIGIEVFGRDEGFTQDDPVVRIEAGRLRRAIEHYYLVAGSKDPVRIEIPKGGYVPHFTGSATARPADAGAETPPPAAVTAPARRPRPSFVTGLLVIAAVAAIGALYWVAGPPGKEKVALPDGPTLVVAPFSDLGGGPEAKLYARGLTEELLNALPRFRELTVFGRETSQELLPEADAAEVHQQLGARYLLTGGVRVSGDRVRVTARLAETGTGEILWSQTYENDLRSRDLFAIQLDVADQVAATIGQPYGVVARTEMQNMPPDDLGAYRCTVRFYVYRAELDPKQHREVRDCLERAVAQFPAYATAWAMLSIVYIDEDRFGFNPETGGRAALARGLDAARRSVDLDPQSLRGLQALMTALYLNQQLAESLAVGERGLALNPNDTEFIGEYATRLALAGQWGKGSALLGEALARNPGKSGFYHAILALSAYMQGQDEKAVQEIRQANLNALPLFHLVAAVIYAQDGLKDEAKAEADLFVKMSPLFLSNIDAELEKRNIKGPDRLRLLEGIQKAGLAIPHS